jgi:hypothetical protein
MLRRLLQVGLTLAAVLLIGAPPATAAQPAAAAPAGQITIAVFGDYGYCYYACAHEEAVASLVHGWSPNYIVTVGDNSYESGRDFEVQADQRPYAADIKAGRFFQITGNHDWGNTCNASMIQPSTDYFGRPPHYTAHLGQGLLDLFALDMNCGDPDGDSPNSVQAQQYRADVSASTATWKISADHQPFYSSGKWGTQTYTHWAILPQIDLFLSGHDHDMEHMVEGGQNFVVTGAGGKSHDRDCVLSCIPGSVWHNDTDFGATRLTITKTTLKVEFVSLTNQVLHAFTIRKDASSPGTAPAPAKTPSAQLPLRAAFYYPWFPEAWNQKGVDPYTVYHPELGTYDSSNAALVSKQIAAMQYGQIQAGIASWWGRGSATDSRIHTLLSAAAGTGFLWALYYEPEAQGDPTAARIAADIAYIKAAYANDPSYLRIDGRFVIFVYTDAKDGCGTLDRWAPARAAGAYVVMRVFPGYTKCANQPDGWHQYAPAQMLSDVRGQSFSISPGFHKVGEAPRLDRDLAAWYADILAMVQSHEPWQLVTTFNEWGEGTAVEDAQEWSGGGPYGAYLQALHDNGKQQDDVDPGTRITQAAAVLHALRPLAGTEGVLLLPLLLLGIISMYRLLTVRGRGQRPPGGGFGSV